MKPANQFGSGLFLFWTNDLSTGVISGKAFSNLWDRPRFIEALRSMILHNPPSVRCSLSFKR